MNIPTEQSITEDTDVLNNLLSNLKTGRVQRQSMRRLPNYELANVLSNNKNQGTIMEKSSPQLQRKLADQTLRPIDGNASIKTPPVLVIPNNLPAPNTSSTVKFRRNRYNFSENRE